MKLRAGLGKFLSGGLEVVNQISGPIILSPKLTIVDWKGMKNYFSSRLAGRNLDNWSVLVLTEHQEIWSARLLLARELDQ